jgi:ABC-type bacteriocin/lantibiotic exporter with double-glycine peptidase domain
MLNALPVLKASGAEQRAQERWRALYWRKRHIHLYGQKFRLFRVNILALLQGLLTRMLTFWAGFLVIKGELQLGEMLALTMMAGAFQSAISGAGNLYLQLIMMKPQLDHTRQILDQPALPPRPQVESQPLPAPVVVQDLWFRYQPEGPWVLRGLNLEIRPGEKLLVRGPSGCGKSTFLKLLAGLYVPERGALTLAGFPPEQARHFLSYLPQFVRLFDRSILENLRLLSGAASRERLMVAAGHSGLDELVQTLPMGYETLVNAGGATFSGGQRQLIALTAVLASSKSVLVLDEAMANIDPIWKARLLRSPLFLDRTVIFASHDEDQSRDGPTFAGARQITIGSERHEPFH